MSQSIENRLVPLVAKLRSNAEHADAHLKQLQQRFEPEQARIVAFMAEPVRFSRMSSELAKLAAAQSRIELRGALFGVPVGIKDIIHVDGMDTTAGSRLPPQVLAGPQASCVTRLVQAGALILGKTVSTEFAYFSPGPTRNPHNLEYTPGGSSSGSAAAVAAGLCPLALGSQTVGSVIRPAAFCGVVGFKPTFGRIPIDGVIPYSPTVDTLGFFTADVSAAVAAAAVLCDNWQEPPPPPRKPVLGVPQGPYLDQTTTLGMTHFDATRHQLEQAGYSIRPVDALAKIDAIAQRHQDLIAAEFALGQRDWFAEFCNLYQPVTAEQIRYGQTISAQRLASCQQSTIELRSELDELMATHELDAWICPAATGPAPHGIDTTGNPAMNMPWTHARIPVVSIPSSWSDTGLPLGLQLVGRWAQDEQLLAWAGAIERDLVEHE